MKETVNKPNHYIGEHGLEVEEVLINFLTRYANSYEAHRIASAIEYLLRSPLKNGTEDLRKAKRNIEQVLEYRENEDIKNLMVGDVVNINIVDDKSYFERTKITYIDDEKKYVEWQQGACIYGYEIKKLEIEKCID